MTNETIASQLAHRTIRAYKDQPLTEAEVTTLMDVARHTATSSFLQSCTVLHITDPQVRETIGAASRQPYVGGTKGDLFIFVADLYRNSRIRADLQAACAKSGDKLYLPELKYCGDNAAMIGCQGFYEYQAGHVAGLDLNAYATRDISLG